MSEMSPLLLPAGTFVAGLVIGFVMGRSAPRVDEAAPPQGRTALAAERPEPAAQRPALDDAARARIRAVLASDGKIAAIKLYRELTGAGLKDAKDAVEALE